MSLPPLTVSQSNPISRREFFSKAGLGALVLSSWARTANGASLQLDGRNFDVAVYSGVPGGIAAAIAAARSGVSVILIEPTSHVGGLSTSGINTAESEHMLKWTIGGFALEFYRQLGAFYGSGQPEYYFESSVAEKVYLRMLAEAGVAIHFGARLEHTKKLGTQITQIVLSDKTEWGAAVWVDASYEGDLTAGAGVSCAIGRESQKEFGEEAAGIRFDRLATTAKTTDGKGNLLPGISGWTKDYREGDAHVGVMGYNFRPTVTLDPKYKIALPAPNRYDPLRYAVLADWLKENAQEQNLNLRSILDLYARRNGKFEVNNKQAAILSLGNSGAQFGWPSGSAAERNAIYDDHLNYTLGLFQFLGHDAAVPARIRDEMRAFGLHRDEFVGNENLPYQLYVREGRRMRGAYVVCQKDVTTDRRKPDAIGLSSHFIDSHHVQRLAVSESQFVNEGRIWRIGHAWQMPYRMLTPKTSECSNLLVSGAASLSHVAFCTYRLESVWMISGYAAGLAAALAMRGKTSVQSIDLGLLQGQLRDHGQVLDFVSGLPEKCEALNGPPEV